MEHTPVRYHSIVGDSARWNGFEFRDDDIVISAPPKSGMTWTQTICGLLIFQSRVFPRPMDLISPWLDQLTRGLDDVVADLEAQEHRRFIKTHTPLDGLLFDERVTYICVGRDPRDVALSWDNNVDNLDIGAFLNLRGAAVGFDDLADVSLDGLAGRPASERDRFWQWVEGTSGLTQVVTGLAFTLHHLSTFWEARSRPNVVLLHYGDLKADLEGQMRGLAARLGIDVADELWGEFVRAATFDEMRNRAKDAAPNATEPIWVDTTRFFNKGTSGQWKHLLDADDLLRYEACVSELADPELAAWAHRGPITG